MYDFLCFMYVDFQIESTLNKGLNAVLKLMPKDPLSLMAATLIDVSFRNLCVSIVSGESAGAREAVG